MARSGLTLALFGGLLLVLSAWGGAQPTRVWTADDTEMHRAVGRAVDEHHAVGVFRVESVQRELKPLYDRMPVYTTRWNYELRVLRVVRRGRGNILAEPKIRVRHEPETAPLTTLLLPPQRTPLKRGEVYLAFVFPTFYKVDNALIDARQVRGPTDTRIDAVQRRLREEVRAGRCLPDGLYRLETVFGGGAPDGRDLLDVLMGRGTPTIPTAAKGEADVEGKALLPLRVDSDRLRAMDITVDTFRRADVVAVVRVIRTRAFIDYRSDRLRREHGAQLKVAIKPPGLSLERRFGFVHRPEEEGQHVDPGLSFGGVYLALFERGGPKAEPRLVRAVAVKGAKDPLVGRIRAWTKLRRWSL